MSTPEIARLLRAIADVIERSNTSEIQALTRALADNGSRPKKGKTAASSQRPPAMPDFASISQKIIEASSRDEAIGILHDIKLTRRELTKFGQQHSIHIVKEDTISVIETKIVETLVGTRLNSKAIRGEK